MSLELGTADFGAKADWESPTLVHIGAFAAILKGSKNVGSDPGIFGKNQGSDLALKSDVETVDESLKRLRQIGN